MRPSTALTTVIERSRVEDRSPSLAWMVTSYTLSAPSSAGASKSVTILKLKTPDEVMEKLAASAPPEIDWATPT